VYFPRTALISMVRRMRDGTMVEAGVVGHEGMAGLAIAFGNTSSPEIVLASVPGIAHRLPARRFHELLPALPVLSGLLDRYALALIDQLGQTIACNSLHSIEQRCARWLLNAHDTAGHHDFHLTHEVLARMLGVRRAGVTVAALVLQREKLIDYSRGRVVILNRHGLEEAACECHALMRARIERFLGKDSPRL
jgi:CRP-like cAMP-binding protein